MSSWVHAYKAKVAELERYADALERRESELIKSLELASQGYQPSDWTGTNAEGIKRLAASKLASIAKMERPRRPIL